MKTHENLCGMHHRHVHHQHEKVLAPQRGHETIKNLCQLFVESTRENRNFHELRDPRLSSRSQEERDMAQEISNTRPVSSLKTQNPSNTLAWWHHFKASKSGETPTPPVFCTMAPWLLRRFMLVLHAKVHLGLSARRGP